MSQTYKWKLSMMAQNLPFSVPVFHPGRTLLQFQVQNKPQNIPTLLKSNKLSLTPVKWLDFSKTIDKQILTKKNYPKAPCTHNPPVLLKKEW